VIVVRQTDRFRRWLDGLRDPGARERILARVRRLSLGNPGDIRSLRGGLSELRTAHGPGYRIHLMQEGSEVVILLAGGDKRTQARDIAAARALVRQLRDAP